MALPATINPTTPAGADARKLGDDQIRALKQSLIDILGLPNNQAISGAVFSINTSGQISAISITGTPIDSKYIDFVDLANTLTQAWFKGASPNIRLVGTEGNAKDWRIIEDGGVIKLQQNTGTEGSPTWSDRVIVTSTGTFRFYSGTAFGLELSHNGTAYRTVRIPAPPTAAISDVVLTDAAQTLTNKTLTSPRLDTVERLSMGVNKPIVPGAVSGTPDANSIYSNSVVKAWARIDWSVGVPSIAASYNVSGIVDDGAGLITIQWDRNFSGTGYAVVAMPASTTNLYAHVETAGSGQTAGDAQIEICNENGTASDPVSLSVIAIGAQ